MSVPKSVKSVRRRCKFCQCTERAACQLVAVKLRDLPSEPALHREFYFLGPTKFPVIPADATAQLIPCEWLPFLDDDVCSNPRCVEQAYLEARPLAEELDAEEALLENSPFETLVNMPDDGRPVETPDIRLYERLAERSA